jgi:hypothetical protein
MGEATRARKAWAVLAYTVADDKGGGGSLDVAAQKELKAMCDAADFGRVSIAAQVDFKRLPGVFRGTLDAAPPPKGTVQDASAENHPLWRKILGQVDAERSTVRVQTEEHDLSAARANVVQDFLCYGQREIPAARYVIFFYGHSYGPMGLFCDAESGQREPDTLRLNELAGSIQAAGGRAAILVFRDCFMNTLEAAYQLRHAAEFMIATQSLAPIAGVWPWPGFMEALLPDAPSADVARALAVQLAHFLDAPKNRAPFAEVPYSLLDLGAAERLAEPLEALVQALEAARADPRRSRACGRALERARVGYPDDSAQPGDPALLDVPTLCANLQALSRDPVSAPARALGEAVGNTLVRWHHPRTGGHRGTSLYYRPVKEADLERSHLQAEDAQLAATDAAHYKTLGLSLATGWDRIALDPFPIR